MQRHVVIIGAGIIGAASAYECLRAGHRVTIVDPDEAGGEHAASYGNGALISNAFLLPIATPGLWRQVPGYLLDPLGPFAIRWSHLPKLVPWLVRFARSGATLERIEATAKARHALCAHTFDMHKAMAEAAGVGHLLAHNGILFIYPDRSHYSPDDLDWRMRRAYGVHWRELDARAVRELEPGIGPAYTFGCHISDSGNLTDPGGYVAGIIRYAVSQGATLVRERATGFVIVDGRLQAVSTPGGGIACDKAIICAGIRSTELARQAGDDIPLESERGYHVVIADPEYVPRRPVMPSDGKMSILMTRAGLRVAGQVELGGLALAPNWKRADILLQWLTRLYPAFPRQPDPSRIKRWMGHRPSTPDSLPALGPASGCADIIHGFGHGHSGFGLGPGSAKLLANFVSGVAPNIDPAPYSPQRFR